MQQRTLYLRLPIDSVGHCTRYANIEVFSEPKFPLYEQNPRTKTGKQVLEKICIFVNFTQCDVFNLLAQKFTNFENPRFWYYLTILWFAPKVIVPYKNEKKNLSALNIFYGTLYKGLD